MCQLQTEAMDRAGELPLEKKMDEGFSRPLKDFSAAEVIKPQQLTTEVYGGAPGARPEQFAMTVPSEMLQITSANVRGDFIIGNVVIKPDGLTVDGETVTDAGEIYAALTRALNGGVPVVPGLGGAAVRGEPWEFDLTLGLPKAAAVRGEAVAVSIDSMALAAATKIMGYFFEPIPGVQLKAKIQIAVREAMKDYRRGNPVSARAADAPSEPTRVCLAWTRPISYTDTMEERQVRRDDLWAITTQELSALTDSRAADALDSQPKPGLLKEFLAEAKAAGITHLDFSALDSQPTELPPLPESDWTLAGSANNRDAYTADQMREYGRLCATQPIVAAQLGSIGEDARFMYRLADYVSDCKRGLSDPASLTYLISYINDSRASSAPVAPIAPDAQAVNTITLTGHQLVAALDLIAPGLPRDPEELDNDLNFGVRQHKDDDGIVSTGMCCWNDDTDGVLPLDEYPDDAAPQQEGSEAVNGRAELGKLLADAQPGDAK